jgi:hypothetical protein
MAKVKRTNDEWRVLLAEQRASGQTQEEWCVANSVNLYTLRDRACRLKRLDREMAARTDQDCTTVPAGWIEVKPESLQEIEDPATFESNEGGRSSMPKNGFSTNNTSTIKKAPKKKAIDICILREDWTITLTADFEAGLLADVLRAVSQACC